MKKLLVIVVSLMVFLCLYTIAFQLYFGPPSMPDYYSQYQLSEKARRETLKEIADSLENDNAAKYYVMTYLEMTPLPEDVAPDDGSDDATEESPQENDPELEECIAANEPAFVLFRKGLKQERYFLPKDNPFEAHYWHVSSCFFDIARLLKVKGRLHKTKGQYEEAAETYLNLLRFSADISDDGGISSALGGVASERWAYRGLDSLLGHLEDETTCEELLKKLIDIEGGRASLSELLEYDRAYQRESLGNASKYALYLGDPPIDPTVGDYLLDTMRRTGEYLLTRLTLPIYIRKTDKFYTALIDISEKPYPEIFREPLEGRIPTDILSKIMLPGIEKFMLTAATQETTRRGHILKIALHLHLLKNKEYPETLEELAATVPEHIFIDPFSENRFIYKKTDKGYLLYSVGGDLDDDGGEKAERPWAPGADGDMVFEPPEPEPQDLLHP